MLGSLTGDIVGSIYEWNNIKTTTFPLFQDHCRFTDDSVLTVALAESILTGEEYGSLMKRYFRNYPDVGYGSNFLRWAQSESATPYNSWETVRRCGLARPLGPSIPWGRCCERQLTTAF